MERSKGWRPIVWPARHCADVYGCKNAVELVVVAGMRTLKFILLPLLGVLAALIAFRLAAPYEDTLTRPGMGSEDPAALFTWGTKWGEVNRIAFGAFLCSSFAVVLTIGRQSVLRVILAGTIGLVMGGFVNFITDSSADLIGIAISTKAPGAGSLIAMLAWCLLVPLGIVLTLVVAQGVSTQRIKRAIFSLKTAALASFTVQMVGGMLAVQDGNGEINLQSQIPVWRMVEIAVGLAVGCTILIADEWIRTGSIRLMHGKNEFVDWSLDYAENRIGSAEGSQIYIRGYKGVEPMHAVITRQGDQFILEAHAPTLVNNIPVSQVALQPHDIITVGDAQLVFRSNVGYSWRTGAIQGYRMASAPVYTPTPYQPAPIPQYPSAVIPTQQGHAGYTTNPYQPSPTPYPSPATPQYPNTVTPQHQGISKLLQDSYGNQIPLPPGRYSVGKDTTNAICISYDAGVSSVHAEIIVTPTDIIVSDLQSATGTRINGVPVTYPTTLRPGETVEFGTSRFTCIR